MSQLEHRVRGTIGDDQLDFDGDTAADSDVLQACGGAKKIFTLTLPQTMEILLTKVGNEAETREKELINFISVTNSSLSTISPTTSEHESLNSPSSSMYS